MQAFLKFVALIMLNYWWVILGALIIWNAVVYSMYADDKRRALAGVWRYRETDLLAAAFYGGAIGAIAACMKTRHKTRKMSFANRLFNIALFQMLLFGGLIGLTLVYVG